MSELPVRHQIQENRLWKAPHTCKSDQYLVYKIQPQADVWLHWKKEVLLFWCTLFWSNPITSAKSHLNVWKGRRVDEKFMRLSAPDTTSGQTTPAQVAPLLKLKSGRILTNQDCSYTCDLHPTYQGSLIGTGWCILNAYVKRTNLSVYLFRQLTGTHSSVFSPKNLCPCFLRQASVCVIPNQTQVKTCWIFSHLQ